MDHCVDMYVCTCGCVHANALKPEICNCIDTEGGPLGGAWIRCFLLPLCSSASSMLKWPVLADFWIPWSSSKGYKINHFSDSFWSRCMKKQGYILVWFLCRSVVAEDSMSQKSHPDLMRRRISNWRDVQSVTKNERPNQAPSTQQCRLLEAGYIATLTLFKDERSLSGAQISDLAFLP